MYRVIRLSCFPSDYNLIVLPQVHRQQRRSSERWIGQQSLRSHSPSNHILCHFSLYRSLSNYIDIVIVPLFAHHHNFSSPFTFFFFFLFCSSFMFFVLFSHIISPLISATLFFLVFSSSFSLLHSLSSSPTFSRLLFLCPLLHRYRITQQKTH